jgi:hypothetical protein
MWARDDGGRTDVTDEAQAVSEVAKFGTKALEVVSGVGRYAAEVFGTMPHDAVGLFGDKLRHRRLRNAAKLAEETRVLLEGIDAARLSEPSPSVIVPLLMWAADEERNELQSLWAKLLANAAIDGGKKVRREFFETLRQLEPLDALALATMFALRNEDMRTSGMTARLHRDIPEKTGRAVGAIELQVSMQALDRLGCAKLMSDWLVTPYGQTFVAACQVE